MRGLTDALPSWRLWTLRLLCLILTLFWVTQASWSVAQTSSETAFKPQPAVKQRLAVLELNNRAQLTGEESKYLTDLLRRTTSELLRGKLVVMTRENIQVMLPPGRALEDCVGECEVQTGQLLGAHYVITGSIIKFGQFFRVTIKLHDTQSGELLGTEVAGAENLLALEQQIQVKGQQLIRKILSGAPLKPQGRVQRRTLTRDQESIAQYGGGARLIVTLRSEPSGAGISIDGSQRCSEGEAVCRVELTAGAHDVTMALKDYFTKRASVTFGKSEVRELTWRLEPNFVHLEIIPTPKTLSYQINGTQYRGSRVKRAKPNTRYKIITDDPCYARTGEEVSAPVGERVVVKLTPKRQRSLLDISAVGSKGEPLEVTVRVDQGEAHQTPARFEVDTCAKSITATHPSLPSLSAQLTLRPQAMKRMVLRFDTDRRAREAREAQAEEDRKAQEKSAREAAERYAASSEIRDFYRQDELFTWFNLQSGAYFTDRFISDPTPYYGVTMGFELHWDSAFITGKAWGAKGFVREGNFGLLFDVAYVLFPLSLGGGKCWGRGCLSLSFDFGSFLIDNVRLPGDDSDGEGRLISDDDEEHNFVPTRDSSQSGAFGIIPISLKYSHILTSAPKASSDHLSVWRLVLEVTGVPFNQPYRWFPTPEPGLYPTPQGGQIPLFIGVGLEYTFVSKE